MRNQLYAAALTLGAALLLTGCLTRKNLDKHNDKFPLESAQYYLKKFPPQDSVGEVVFDSIAKATNQDYSYFVDSIANEVDSISTSDSVKPEQLTSLKKKVTTLKAQYKPCKPDTVFKTQIVYRTNGALQTAYDELGKVYYALRVQNAKNEAKSHTRLWMFIAACAVILLLIVLLFKK